MSVIFLQYYSLSDGSDNSAHILQCLLRLTTYRKLGKVPVPSINIFWDQFGE